MHKHSVSVPVVPASAPTSPAAVRLSKMERAFGLPVTPQRIIRPQKTLYRSPVTPASTSSTPYTPLSLRSFSTNSSSTLNTPDSATSFKHFPVVHFPETEATTQLADKDLADIAVNWRSRANENGIKVATAEDSSFGDDEGAYMRLLKWFDRLTSFQSLSTCYLIPIILCHSVALMTLLNPCAASDRTPSDANEECQSLRKPPDLSFL